MSHLKRLLMAGVAAPFVVVAAAPSHATPYGPAATPVYAATQAYLVLAQADDECPGEDCPADDAAEAENGDEAENGAEAAPREREGLRQRMRERGETREERRDEARRSREQEPEAASEQEAVPDEVVEERDEEPAQVGQPEAAEDETLRQRLRERRQQERAEDDTRRDEERAAEEPAETTEEPAEAAEEPAETVEEPTEAAEEPAERAVEREREPGIVDRIRRAIVPDEPGEQPVAEEPAPEVGEPERAEERGLRERLRERREGERAERPRREGERARERAREAQQELEDIAREREELREEVEQLQEQRREELQALEREIRERREGEVVRRSDDRMVVRQNGRFFVQGNDSRRFMRRAENVETRRRGQNLTETVIERAGGERVVTVRDRYGDIVSRTRILRDGTEIVLIDNHRRGGRERPRRRVDYYSQVLPPLVIDIPREQYIVETRQASRRDIRRALTAPPVEQVREVYTLDDVLYNERIRDMVARVDLDTITFEFDSAEVPDDQIDTLEDIGMALEEIITENPREIFLVEGHTDAPGSNEYNLALSDRRAENVAIILTEFFDIPPENLVTQGYGEEYLKIDTQERERRNRRVTVRRITPLMAEMR